MEKEREEKELDEKKKEEKEEKWAGDKTHLLLLNIPWWHYHEIIHKPQRPGVQESMLF